jgi:hypothetical protein
MGGQTGRRGAQDRATGVGSVGQVGGERGDAEVRARGGSVGRLDRWILVIDL